MKELATFKGDHFIVHVHKDVERTNDLLKDYSYELLISSKYVAAPCDKDELKELIKFLQDILDDPGENTKS